ncbi:MAG: hypothetical protein RI894_590 [Bacteroidota bacterium]|jgi:hypothetical protein
MKLLYSLFFVPFAVFVLTTTSCTQDPCQKNKIDCKNGGACSDGSCVCAYAFEGSLCENRITKVFTGSYNGTETDTVATTVKLSVTESLVAADKIQLELAMMMQKFSTYSASVKHDGSFLIADQLLVNKTDTFHIKSDTLHIYGSGKRTDKTLNYILYYVASPDSVGHDSMRRRVTGSVTK